MTTVEAIEEAIKQLPQPDLIELQRWFADFYGDICGISKLRVM